MTDKKKTKDETPVAKTPSAEPSVAKTPSAEPAARSLSLEERQVIALESIAEALALHNGAALSSVLQKAVDLVETKKRFRELAK